MRGFIGATVRLYGYPGLFKLESLPDTEAARLQRGIYDFYAVSNGKSHFSGFGVLDSSIVEINGDPVPLLSCPMAPPAWDYPHYPEFDYQDGPQARGAEAAQAWQAREEKPIPAVARPNMETWQKISV